MTTPSGYTRQAAANINSGLEINAEDFNAEYNQLQLAFDNTTGHDHTGGAAGTGAKINLGTSTSGILTVANGGTGVITSTGSGANVLSNSPTIVTPVISAINSNVTVSGQLHSTGALIVSSGGYDVTGDSLVRGGLLTTGLLKSEGELVVSAGGANITGAAIVSGTLDTTSGLTVSAGGMHVTGTSVITGGTTISGAAIVSGTLDTTGGLFVSAGGATLKGTSVVSGTLNATGGVSDNGSRVVSNNNKFAASTFASASSVTTLGAGVGKMAGLGSSMTITPAVTGRVLITAIAATSNNSGATFVTTIDIRIGTGTAPVTGAAISGTQVAQNYLASNASSADLVVPASITGITTGLTLATTYWIDLSVLATTGSMGTITNITLTAIEI